MYFGNLYFKFGGHKFEIWSFTWFVHAHIIFVIISPILAQLLVSQYFSVNNQLFLGFIALQWTHHFLHDEVVTYHNI